MPEDNRTDICGTGIEYLMLSLISHKINALIIGGGRAGYIKAKTFSENGCRVCVLSKHFIDEFSTLENADDIRFIESEYNIKYLSDNHIVIIATDDDNINENIKNDCEALKKIYLMCSNFKDGMFVVPTQGTTENIQYAIHTKHGSPKTSVFLAEMFGESLKEYDAFAGYVCSLRDNLKHNDSKNEIMEFVNTKEFFEAFKMGNHEKVLKLNFGGSIIGT